MKTCSPPSIVSYLKSSITFMCLRTWEKGGGSGRKTVGEINGGNDGGDGGRDGERRRSRLKGPG